MKHILTTILLAATAFVAMADDKSTTEKARDTTDTVVEKSKEIARETTDAVVDATHQAERAARAAWDKTKAYLSDEAPVYQGGAQDTLAGLAKEIADVKAQTPSTAPAYFRTRLVALDEQHGYLVKRLAQLSPDHLKDRSSGPRHDFDQCVSDLEKGIDLAKDDAGALSKTAQGTP